MSKASTHSFELGRASSSTTMIDKCVIIPISACVFASIVSPLLLLASRKNEILIRPENRFVWPALAAISIVLAVRNRSRLSRFALPPHIVCLLAYLAFAGASTLWAFDPELSFSRFAQQVMIVARRIIRIVSMTYLVSFSLRAAGQRQKTPTLSQST
jgi:hypothetical protein